MPTKTLVGKAAALGAGELRQVGRLEAVSDVVTAVLVADRD